MASYSLGKKCKVCGLRLLNINKTGFCNHHRDRTGTNNPFYGRQHSQETILKIKKTSSLTSKKCWQKEEYRRKVISGVSKPRRSGFGEEQSKRVKEWYRNNPKQRTLRSGHMRKSWQLGKIVKGNYSCNSSNIELEFYNRLKDLCPNLEEKRTVRVGDKWFFPDIVDLKGGIIIEFYGDYWHANPKLYGKGEVFKNKLTAQQIWDKDWERIRGLEGIGFKVFVVWQSEYENDPEFILGGFEGLLNWEGCAL